MNPAHYRVLIVDDERPTATTLGAILSMQGYETRTAQSAESALQILGDWIPDLAVIDVVLTQMNGIDLAILMKEQCPACRVLLFSGQVGTVDLLATARDNGHNFDILAKPVHPTVLLSTIDDLLKGSPSLKDPPGDIPLV